jgi:hypothetical protein
MDELDSHWFKVGFQRTLMMHWMYVVYDLTILTLKHWGHVYNIEITLMKALNHHITLIILHQHWVNFDSKGGGASLWCNRLLSLVVQANFILNFCLWVHLSPVPKLQHALLPLKCYKLASMPRLFSFFVSLWDPHLVPQGVWGHVMSHYISTSTWTIVANFIDWGNSCNGGSIVYRTIEYSCKIDNGKINKNKG